MTTAKRVKDAKIQEKFQQARDKKEQRPKFSTRRHNRCKLCGRPRGYLRKFGICRLCFRGLALRGEIPGVSKSSWYGCKHNDRGRVRLRQTSKDALGSLAINLEYLD